MAGHLPPVVRVGSRPARRCSSTCGHSRSRSSSTCCWPPLLVLGLRTLGRKRLLTTMLAVALASSVLMAIARERQHQRRVLLAPTTRLVGAAARFGDGVLLRAVPDPRQARARRARRARRRRAARPARAAVVVRGTSPSRRSPAGDVSVFRGGFLLVDVATLLVIAAVVHPRSDAGTMLGCRPLRWIGAALLQPLPLALPDLLRHPPRPRRPAARLAADSCCASCCRSAPPSCRTATSRRRSAAARSAATSTRLRTEHGEPAPTRRAPRRRGRARVGARRWSRSARASRARRARRRSIPGANAQRARPGDRGQRPSTSDDARGDQGRATRRQPPGRRAPPGATGGTGATGERHRADRYGHDHRPHRTRSRTRSSRSATR